MPLTTCNTTQYESKAPKSKKVEVWFASDRTCASLTGVLDEQYVTVNHTATSDRTVADKTACGDKQHEQFSGSTYADRVCVDKPLCIKGVEGSYLDFLSQEGPQDAYVQPANSSVPCRQPEEHEKETTTEAPVAAAVEEQRAEAGIGGGEIFAIILVILIVFLVAGVAIFNYSQPVEDTKLRPSGAADDETTFARVVSKEADVPFAKGDFWQVEETDTEMRPMTYTFQRKALPPRPTSVRSEIVDSEYDTEDEENVAGGYNITLEQPGQTETDGTNMVQLISQSDQANMSVMMPPMSPMGAYPPATPGMQQGAYYGGMPQDGVLINQSYGAMSPGMNMTGMQVAPTLDYSSLPGLDMSALGAQPVAAVPVPAANADDEEDTKL